MTRRNSAIIVLMLAVMMLLACGFIVEAEAVYSGKCGDDLTWTIDSQNVLTISGEGDMDCYSYSDRAPWYAYREQVTELVIEQGVTGIGDYAFSDCKFTGDLVIPEGVKVIGDDAFDSCGFTGTLSISNTVEKIGDEAFRGCGYFTGDLIIPNSVLEIGSSAFLGCEGFTGQLVLSNKIKEIESITFYGCGGLTGELRIPEGVTEIGGDAFCYCSNLEKVIFEGDAPSKLGEDAFGDEEDSLKLYYYLTKKGWTSPSWNGYSCEGICPGHSIKKVEAKSATCVSKGNIEYYACEICHQCFADAAGEQAVEESDVMTEIDPAAHCYEDWKITIDPSCTQKGYTIRVCKLCGYNDKYDEITAEGHKYGDWETVSDSSCTEAGLKQRECSVCGHIQTRDIEKKEHSFSDWEQTAVASCVDKACFERECSVCHKLEKLYMKANGHSYEHIVKKAEIGVDGKAYDKCSICGDVINELSIPALDAPKPTISKLVASTKAVTVYWSKKSGISGYKIRYSTKSSMSGAKILTVKGATVASKKIAKLSAKKTYYVQVQTYRTVNGKTYSSAWSGKKSIRIK